MTHFIRVGAVAGTLVWIAMGIAVFAIPHPSAKVLGVSMLWPGPMHFVAAGVGGSLTSGWGHPLPARRQPMVTSDSIVEENCRLSGRVRCRAQSFF